MAMRKVNDNGPGPEHPNPEVPATAAEAVRDAADDIDYAAGERAKRKGLCCDYTRAPWLVKP